jgi:hypothetical protein
MAQIVVARCLNHNVDLDLRRTSKPVGRRKTTDLYRCPATESTKGGMSPECEWSITYDPPDVL